MRTCWSEAANAARSGHLWSGMLCNCDESHSCSTHERTITIDGASYAHHCDAVFPGMGSCDDPIRCCAHFASFIVNPGERSCLRHCVGDSLSATLCKIVASNLRCMSDQQQRWYLTPLQQCCILRPQGLTANVTHMAVRARMEMLLCMTVLSEGKSRVGAVGRLLSRNIDTHLKHIPSSDTAARGLLLRTLCLQRFCHMRCNCPARQLDEKLIFMMKGARQHILAFHAQAPPRRLVKSRRLRLC